MKIVCVILFLLRRVFGVSIADADGTNFEDTFKRFESALWRRDRGSRQCGAMGLPTGNCIFAKYDNIKYVSNPDAEGLSPESNEMIISMRNDCSDNSCCDDSTICTSYTSGMMTSKQSYGYGSFQFLLKIESETKDYEIYSSSFKSAHCMSSPNPEDYPYIFKKASGVGYCENHNANLARFSSNRDLCDGRKRDICARFRWKISNVNPTTLRWKNRGYNQIDYVSSAIFVDGTLFAHGGRKLMQEFDVTLKAGQKHTIDVYAFEDCCAGNNNEGYFGWDIEKISRQDSREELMDSYGHGGSTRGGKQRLLPRSLPSSTSKAGASDKGSSSDSTIFRAEKRRKRARDNPEASTTTTQMTTTPPIDEVPGAHTTAEAHTTSESRTLPESEVTYRTSSPTGDPTTSPTGMPLTSIHSAAPSLAGWVATVSTTASTTEEVEQSTINEFTTDLAEYYGVDEEDISVTATYSATGSMQVTIPSDVTEDEMVDAIISSIANSLGVHPSDVDVIVDMETGAVEFSVTSDSFGEASDNQFDLDSANFQNGIIDAIETAVPDASVDQFEVADDINDSLEFTIDADEATNDLTQAAWQSEQLLSSFGDVDVETVYRTGAPSLRPSVTPTTSLLTAAPSITEKLPVPRSTLTGPRASKSPPIQSETKPREPSPDFFPGRITPNAGSPAEGPLLDPPKRAKGSWNTGPAVETFDNLKTLMDENEHLKNMLNAERAKVVELQNSGGCSTEPCEYDSQNYSEIGTASDSSLGSAHDDQHEAAAVEDPPSQNAPASSAGSPVGDTSTIGLAGSVGSPATADGTMDLQPTPGGSDADASDNDCSECCSSEAIPDPKPCCAQVKCAEHWFRTPESSPNAVAEGLGLNLPGRSQEHAKQPRPPQSPNLGPWSKFEGSAPRANLVPPYLRHEPSKHPSGSEDSPMYGTLRGSELNASRDLERQKKSQKGARGETKISSDDEGPMYGSIPGYALGGGFQPQSKKPSVPDSERNMGPWTEFEESSVPESPFLGPVPESADVFSEFEDHDCQGDECSRRKSTTEEAYYTTKEAKPSSTTEGPDGTPDPTVEPSDIAVICVSLQRMFIAFGEIGLAKISMCIMSCQSRQAVLIASLGRDMYKETVDLPFDAASRVGRYSIDWLPNKIVWKVDKMSLRTVGHNLAPIPDKAMHIKLYVVPENPSTIDQNSMVEHKLHLFSAKYEKFSNEKTELFVLGGGKNTLLRFITFASGLVVLATLVIHHFWFTNKEEEFPTGYMMLQAGELTEDI